MTASSLLMPVPLEKTIPDALQRTERSFTRQTPSHIIRDVCQAVFVAELLQPGDVFWIAVPHIFNAPLIDNRTNAFHHLEPNWPQSQIRLLSILNTLLEQGTTLRLLTLKTTRNQKFLNEFRSLNAATAQASAQTTDQWTNWTEGIAGTSFVLNGSLQFSRSGPALTGEAVLHIDNEAVARGREAFRHQWP